MLRTQRVPYLIRSLRPRLKGRLRCPLVAGIQSLSQRRTQLMIYEGESTKEQCSQRWVSARRESHLAPLGDKSAEA
jgi:hypothetical protein